MKVTVVYGTERKGCTYAIAQMVIAGLDPAETREIFLPRDLPEFCISCMQCFVKEKGTCAHARYTAPIREQLLGADVIILTSPVYSYHVSGQMKAFLDHFANMWIVHRPEEAMFRKQGIVISTASGPVYASTLAEMKDSLDFWGVAKTEKLGTALMHTEWPLVSESIKAKISRKADRLAKRVRSRHEALEKTGRLRPCFRVRKWFAISRLMQKYLKMNPADGAYWKQMGWTGKRRPWK